jgi:dipeptidase E
LYTLSVDLWTVQYRINFFAANWERDWRACTRGQRQRRNFGPLYNRGGRAWVDHLFMETAPRQIVAFGGGGFSMESGNPLLDDYVLGLTKTERPRVCFLPSASGDADHYIVRFYRAFSAHRCEASHISLFRREQGPEDLRRHLLSQDLIYVGGGSVVSLLGVWRAHGIDAILRECWEAGVILCGLSAGSLCWFAEAVSGFHGAPRRLEGIGLLPFSNCVHYERGSKRGAAYHGFLREGMRAGYAAEDGAALHFTGTELSRVVSSRPEARGYRLDLAGQRVIEIRIATTYLGEGEAIPSSPLPEALSTAVPT